jgi:hypothetical protein
MPCFSLLLWPSRSLRAPSPFIRHAQRPFWGPRYPSHADDAVLCLDRSITRYRVPCPSLPPLASTTHRRRHAPVCAGASAFRRVPHGHDRHISHRPPPLLFFRIAVCQCGYRRLQVSGTAVRYVPPSASLGSSPWLSSTRRVCRQ